MRLGRFSAHPRILVRAPRITADLGVHLSTIGTEDWFKVDTVNVSLSGLLVEIPSHVKTPFVEGTIVEIQVDSELKLAKKPLRFLGKIIRLNRLRFQGGSDAYHFGIKIIQIDGENLAHWEQLIDHLLNSLSEKQLAAIG